jgi:hypothetical protein
MFNVYLINSRNETLALTDDIDAPHVTHFDSIGTLLDYIAQSVGTTGYRVNDDGWTVTPHVVTDYSVFDGRFDITDQVPAALAYRAERSTK